MNTMTDQEAFKELDDIESSLSSIRSEMQQMIADKARMDNEQREKDRES
jgi:hypothetical protein